jgi:hypothetical protein
VRKLGQSHTSSSRVRASVLDDTVDLALTKRSTGYAANVRLVTRFLVSHLSATFGDSSCLVRTRLVQPKTDLAYAEHARHIGDAQLSRIPATHFRVNPGGDEPSRIRRTTTVTGDPFLSACRATGCNNSANPRRCNPPLATRLHSVNTADAHTSNNPVAAAVAA